MSKAIILTDDISGAFLIANERLRQIKHEGYSDEHDDSHNKRAQLALAALGYLELSVAQSTCHFDFEPREMDPHPKWPWMAETWNPSNDQIKNLVRAGALISAEIDRLQRLKAKEAA